MWFESSRWTILSPSTPGIRVVLKILQKFSFWIFFRMLRKSSPVHLPRAKWHNVLNHDGCQGLIDEFLAELQEKVHKICSSSRLIFWGMSNVVATVDVAEANQRTSIFVINVLFPPIRHVVVSPPAFKHQVPLKFLTNAFLEVFSFTFNSLEVLII